MTATISITIESVETELRRLAEAYPDVSYHHPGSGCWYSKGDAGPGQGCIFGQALHNLGVPLITLRTYDLAGSQGSGVTGIRSLMWDLFEIEAPSRWVKVQIAQDIGHPWKEAVTKLDATHE